MLREQIIHKVGNSFSHIEYDHFTMPWHYHDEYELILITSGGGKRFVGDYTDDFEVGDLLLIGSQLPHYHMCYGLINNIPEKVSSCEVIQFTQEIFPQNIDHIEEFSLISDLLKRSSKGVKFSSPPSIERIQKMMRYLDSLSGAKRLAALYRILEILARLSDYKLLTSDSYSPTPLDGDASDTVHKVYKYLDENFRNDISLDSIANHLGYNTAALCRHYKRRTQKSIMETLQEIRVSFACRLLTSSLLSISQIAYECGYKNISNFNRQFLSITKLTPSSYKRLYNTGVK